MIKIADYVPNQEDRQKVKFIFEECGQNNLAVYNQHGCLEAYFISPNVEHLKKYIKNHI